MIKLVLDNIKVEYDNDFQAVKGVSLKINESEILTLLGPSGCGKTSILRSIAGFVKLKSGNIIVGEKNISDTPPQKRNMGMIFQNYALWPHMSVAANISYGLKIRKKSKEEISSEVNKMVKQVQLEDHQTKLPTQLSGGQQQRVALARSMVINPEVLLCDEPLSNLDHKLRVELRTEIREITKRNKITTIYVTHDQTEALAISDRIAVMNFGEVIQLGTPYEIYNNPDHLFVATFIGENNRLKARVELNQDGPSLKLNSGEILSINGGLNLNPDLDIDVVIRYDSVLLSGQKNKVTGKLKHKFFMGAYLQMGIELKDGSVVMLNITEGIEHYEKVSNGDEISVFLPEANLLLFQNDIRVREN